MELEKVKYIDGLLKGDMQEIIKVLWEEIQLFIKSK